MFESYPAEAAALGRQHAENAASWLGPMEVNSARALLGRLADGDPAVWDYLPPAPNLSGEWADGLTPLALAQYVTEDESPDLDLGRAARGRLRVGRVRCIRVRRRA